MALSDGFLPIFALALTGSRSVMDYAWGLIHTCSYPSFDSIRKLLLVFIWLPWAMIQAWSVLTRYGLPIIQPQPCASGWVSQNHSRIFSAGLSGEIVGFSLIFHPPPPPQHHSLSEVDLSVASFLSTSLEFVRIKKESSPKMKSWTDKHNQRRRGSARRNKKALWHCWRSWILPCLNSLGILNFRS